jgi:hypothetical protein
MRTEEKVTLRLLGAICLGVAVGFGAKDWTAGVATFGALIYLMTYGK